MVARIEAVSGARVTQISRDGLAHGDAEAALAEAEVLLRGQIASTVLDHVIERTPNLRWIHSISAGIDKVVTPLSRHRGLQVTNARGVFSRPIAEYVVMMCLVIARRLPQLLDLQRERTWQPLRGEELGGLTVGVIGYGSIGAEVARLLEPFGTRVLATRRRPELGAGGHANVEVWGVDRLHELLRASDVVVIAAPLTDETAGLIGATELQEMPSHAWLINIARGRLVDEMALRRALANGWIGGAVLDVFDEEPLPPDSPLYDTPNLVITPHTSWSSDRVVERSIDLFVANLERYLRAEPLENLVDLEAGY
ncbi:MAG TPA: D-2-hydroxyacid dehydrogenase [Candidatus Limnocylindria bacterium]|nr:D-2-hydroxyacid dehydrogenase [Candidatus Limnocylindria bacterium]